jgi:hypothetical protein
VIGSRSFNDLESGGRDHFCRVHPQQEFVLDNQHHGSPGFNKTHASNSTANDISAWNRLLFPAWGFQMPARFGRLGSCLA